MTPARPTCATTLGSGETNSELEMFQTLEIAIILRCYMMDLEAKRKNGAMSRGQTSDLRLFIFLNVLLFLLRLRAFG